MRKQGVADTQDFFTLRDICFDCWRALVFHNEAFQNLEDILEHPKLHQRFEQLCTFDRSDGATCGFCSASTLPAAVTVKDDVLFEANEDLRTINFDGWNLEDLFSNAAVAAEAYDTQNKLVSRGCTVSRGFNLCVLAVHFARTFGRDKRYPTTFAKNYIKLNLTENAVAHFNSVWRSRVAIASNFVGETSAITSDADDLTLLIRAYFDNAGNAVKNNLEIYEKRLKDVIIGILENEFDTFVSDYQALFRYIDRIYHEDRLLFEQLLRMQIHVSFDVQDRLKITQFDISRDVVTFAGFYNKFARGLSQTVWTLDKNVKSDLSVEECLCLPLLTLCNADTYKFMASGREDCDVRTTGTGRKFCVEVYNCKRDLFLVYELIHKLGRKTAMAQSQNCEGPCQTIACLGELDKVTQDLQVNVTDEPKDHYFLVAGKQAHDQHPTHSITISGVPKMSLTEAFDGGSGDDVTVPSAAGFYGIRVVFNSKTERQIVQRDAENKNKTYSCVVICEEPITLEDLKALPQGPITISQCNPIRTSHRKSQCKRERQIHHISAEPIHPRMFLLHLTTQAGESNLINRLNNAGTYIKEFVSGDYGRTTPSIKAMLGGKAMYVAQLDVVDFS
ncbi:tRNA pseudouridine synthase 10, putative [Babesia ovata]|uniref:tRNA pseudouridine(55) synthase n=1 Tax=Babesia ovata TaxID=189622 RepID=A0A2H6KEJ0_9APIC|nr:tRNA pseudouridine synthase 10, putative [Babesia ovata]GBE61394.1 tRNA pseudouridine synthase 10, putative [Babesia ovata]